jgi:hypothetical protein
MDQPDPLGPLASIGTILSGLTAFSRRASVRNPKAGTGLRKINRIGIMIGKLKSLDANQLTNPLGA